jgi:hypothetical protein
MIQKKAVAAARRDRACRLCLLWSTAVDEGISIHHLALESEYVSQNDNHWIDLIFEYQQRGPEAEVTHNICHHLSYEGSDDLDTISDEIDKIAADTKSHPQPKLWTNGTQPADCHGPSPFTLCCRRIT